MLNLRCGMRVRRSQQRCEQTLQPADQHVGLAASFGQFFDLQILGRNLTAEKIDFTFETGDRAIIGRNLVATGRGWSQRRRV